MSGKTPGGVSSVRVEWPFVPGISTGPRPGGLSCAIMPLEGRIVTKRNAIGIRPEHIRFAVGYGSVSAWGVMMLYVPWAASPGFSLQALLSMVPGLVVCLACLLLFRQHLSLSGRTPLVAGAALLTSLGTLACTYPTLAAIPGAFVTGMALSGGFAILLIMAGSPLPSRILARAASSFSPAAASS